MEINQDIEIKQENEINQDKTCSAKLCDKNGQFGEFVRHIFVSFEPFMNIHASFINTLLY